METMPPERVQSVLSTIMGSGHFSTLEHASYTFAVDGVSRALTHQLVRHRIASFNQQSQRYVKFKGEHSHGEARHRGRRAPSATACSTRPPPPWPRPTGRSLDAGIPAEDARYLLPNACETKIVITMNVRELLHFFELRCCNRAQWEIREMAWKMLELARPTAPYIFADAGAPCIHGTCPEGKMTCGQSLPARRPLAARRLGRLYDQAEKRSVPRVFRRRGDKDPRGQARPSSRAS